jgi:hypothetical protein
MQPVFLVFTKSEDVQWLEEDLDQRRIGSEDLLRHRRDMIDKTVRQSMTCQVWKQQEGFSQQPL